MSAGYGDWFVEHASQLAATGRTALGDAEVTIEWVPPLLVEVDLDEALGPRRLRELIEQVDTQRVPVQIWEGDRLLLVMVP